VRNTNESVDVSGRIKIEERSRGVDYTTGLADDVLRGLVRERKVLPPKYFYDERGSLLFERICDLPEYYQTRTERSILERIAPDLVERTGGSVLVEFGSGSSAKTRVLLSAMEAAGMLRCYVPIDVSREMLLATAEELVHEYEGLDVHAVIGDFNDGLPTMREEGNRLIAFLGGTIGNLSHDEAVAFLRNVVREMTTGDRFLLGVDLVKDVSALNAAYNDSRGVTAEFNLNVLHVINRELGGEFRVEDFYHYAFYDPSDYQIEMHLVSRRDQSVRIRDIGLEVDFFRGETIRTEISRKFTQRSLAALLTICGLEIESWHTDSDRLFALALIRRITPS